MSDNEGMPDTPYREMSFLDEIIDYHRPHKTPKLGGSITNGWRGEAGIFTTGEIYTDVYPNIGFWTSITLVKSLSGVWLNTPFRMQLDPTAPFGAGELVDGDVLMGVDGVANFTGAGTFQSTLTGTLRNINFVPQACGIAIVKVTGQTRLDGGAIGFDAAVVALDVSVLEHNEVGSFVCTATGPSYTTNVSTALGGGLAIGLIGALAIGSWTVTHLKPAPPPPSPPPPPPP